MLRVVQAARLYGGMLEFGYFVRSLVQRMCDVSGIADPGTDSSVLVEYAGQLPDDELQ